MRDGKISRAESVVLLLTGHTLKDSEFTIDFHRGTLLRDDETAGLEQEMPEKRRATVSLEATSDAVLRVLEAAIQA